jgi:hypothetical protein
VTTFVLDNSLAMRWCFEDAAHPYADSILDRLQAGEEAAVPVLWLYEVSAVLARAQNLGSLPAEKSAALDRSKLSSTRTAPIASGAMCIGSP